MAEGANNGPQIPDRTSLTSNKISLTTPKERKRKSLPASPNHDFRRRSSNRVTVKPASPEVISSLIETLSVISAPAEHHFDSLPNIGESRSTPVSPSAWDSHFPRFGSSVRAPPSPLANGFGIDDDGIAESTSLSNTHLHPGHATETPTRRSSKHASEKAMNHKSRGAAYEDSLDDAYSMGAPSIERGAAPLPSPKLPDKKKSLRSLRSARSIRSLTMKNSTNSLRKSDVPVFVAKKEPEQKRERLFLTGSRSPSPTREGLSVKKRDVLVEPVDAFDLLHSTDDTKPLPFPVIKRLNRDSDASSSAGPSHSKRSSYSFTQPGQIPTRNSSKRQSLSYASARRRSRVAQSEHSVAHDSETEAAEDSFVTPPQTPPVTITEFDEGSVNRRIEELKEQKAQRDRLEADVAPLTLDVPAQESRSRSRSSISRTQTPDQTSAGQTEPKLSNGHVESTPPIAENEDTAPSPAIRAFPLRTDRNTDTKITPKIHPNPLQNDQRSFSAPQRANSKLFRKQFRPGTPTSTEKTEKHRRRLSLQIGTRQESTVTAAPRPDSADSIDIAVDEYLSASRLSQQVANPVTGRVISFSEVGDPNGSVIFCCVGMGLTRYVSAFYDDIATALKLRLITPDRPGVGGSEPHPDDNNTPLSWPDDVRTICEHRGITKFSILAHSAGAIYALATALRMPQHIRCRVHLLAPWIPPSQMSAIGTTQEPLPSTAIPYSQRFLRSLPEAWFRAANSNIFSVTSNKITTSLPRSPARKKRNASRSANADATTNGTSPSKETPSGGKPSQPPPLSAPSPLTDKENRPPTPSAPSLPPSTHNRTPSTTTTNTTTAPSAIPGNPTTSATRSPTYDTRLATSIWSLSQLHANPALDLLICLERRQPIGFRYVDITRSVVIHHGSKDSRVPLENVRWLGNMMRRCEVRVLEGEGHGLMASARVMADVLGEMGREWEEWNAVVAGGRR